jgi:hypothetical protein
MLMVFWVGEDNFVYYPFYGGPSKEGALQYRLPRTLQERLGVDVIRPGAIYTDGGSIPRAVRSAVGFSPWGYGPAYIVHDWLFVAHHCIEHNGLDKHDERDRMDAELVRKIDFRTSADILAGVIQALEKQDKVPKRPLAPGAIYTAVDSIVAKNVWDNRDPESCRPVEQEKLENIADKLSSKSFRIETVQPGAPPPVLVYQQAF